MKKVHVTIDGIDVYVPEDYTILEAAKEINISIPTLCFLKDVSEMGCCRMCVVEIEGSKTMQAACVFKVKEGMRVKTHSPKIMKVRRTNLELILSNHTASCLTCTRSNQFSCELRNLANELHVNQVRFENEDKTPMPVDRGVSIVRDPNKCILCRRCVSVCKNIQTVGVIDTINRGFDTVIGGPFNMAVLFYFFSMGTKTAAQNSLYVILISQLTGATACFVTMYLLIWRHMRKGQEGK